jgi:hypothetical protein
MVDDSKLKVNCCAAMLSASSILICLIVKKVCVCSVCKVCHLLALPATLTLCGSYLKPYCMGRKTAFFQQAFKCIGNQERLGWHGTFTQALWSFSDFKGLNSNTVLKLSKP